MSQVVISIIIVMVIALSFGQAAAQQDTAYFAIGTEDGSDMAVGIGMWNELPVFYMGDPDIWIGDIYHVLGARYDIFDYFDSSSCQYYWPFTEGENGWSIKEFGDYNDDTSDYPNPPGWHSLSFTGNARSIYPDAPFLHSDNVPVMILTYSIRAVRDIGLLDQTICDALGSGRGPHEDAIPHCTDTLGTTDFVMVESYSCLWFSPPSFRSVLYGIATDLNNAPIESVHVTIENDLEEIVDEDWTWIDGSYFCMADDGTYTIKFNHDEYFETTVEDFEISFWDSLDVSLWPDSTDVTIWAGNLDGEPITAPISGQTEVNIYFQAQEHVCGEDIMFPLGINNGYFESCDSVNSQTHYPFSQWSIEDFNNLNEDYMTDGFGNTWDSYSFFGMRDGSYGDPPFEMAPGDPPLLGLTFLVNTSEDHALGGLIVNDAIGPGYDPDQGPAYLGDCSGGPLYSLSQLFSPVRLVSYEYLPGDIGMRNGGWPPMAIGGDVTYLVGYFRSGGHAETHRCDLDGFWASADVNGDCDILGSDVTRMVNYFRGMTDLTWCPDYPPAWPTYDDLPTEAPEGWPNCEEY
ncbi:MAG: carboxypeptidase regulatory-like domain-containing protein [candidate division Zixibacteria bacterium]|nr:carboxypeptidase regulatory-like domain-containing protein [candidate division Zixibacteria bacterium]